MHMGFNFSTSLPTHAIVSPIPAAVGCEVVAHVVIMRISLTANDVEHLFMCLLASLLFFLNWSTADLYWHPYF